MNTQTQFGIFATKWEAERAYAAEEIYQLDRERALEDIARLIHRFDLTMDEVSKAVGSSWSASRVSEITPFEPYFGSR